MMTGIWLLPSRISKFLSRFQLALSLLLALTSCSKWLCIAQQAYTSGTHLIMSASRQRHWVAGNLGGVSGQIHMHVTSHKLQWLT